MSELQAALLAIGFGVIVAVYVFGWWQQRRYRRKFGEAFKPGYADALYQAHAGALNQESGATSSDVAPGAESHIAGLSDTVPSIPGLLDDSCSLLNARSDFIIELRLAEPSHAAVLDGLWQRKFDFRKPVQVCGLTLAEKKWERVIAESQVLYGRFRIALQLADRSGAISEAKLADFRDLVLGVARLIKADTTVPDIRETYHHAVELDAFCAEVDQMVGVNLVPPGERALAGGKVAQAVALLGMTLEADGAFHLPDAQGHSLFSLINQDSQPFQHLTLQTVHTPGITLLLDVPRVENPVSLFDRMMEAARILSAELQVNLVDDHRVALSDTGLALIRTRITEVEKKMHARGIEPGGRQARRLFS
ncbi:MAG: Cell division protein ZipA [Candidatus Gallionella acididurans]|uniref:Cell division protein ZipA n=1 Tax=Candidatus Gallionella acididurans TaxID=1796491 RepID=A0A139BQA7_9PROT|nr:MAG: Cell division protein ZipA [Candidatus Gallionella acididurans]